MFANAADERFAVPLADLLRLERVDKTQVEWIGVKPFLKHRDRALPLVHLENVLPVRGGSNDSEEFFVLIPRLAGLEAGIVAARIVDTLESDAQPDATQLCAPGLLGSAIVDDRLTLFLDTARLLEAAGIERTLELSTTSSTAERRFCTFFLGEECYGIDILTVREINRQVQITPARGAPEAVRGFMNLRGQIVTVIDPAVQLGYAPREIKPDEPPGDPEDERRPRRAWAWPGSRPTTSSPVCGSTASPTSSPSPPIRSIRRRPINRA